MRTSAVGRAFIEHWEWRPRSARCGWNPVRQLYFPYPDYRGFKTIGVGHLVKPGEDFSSGITEEHVYQTFGADLVPVELAIDEHVKVPLTQHQFDVLADFGHNEGTGRLEPGRNTAIRMLNLGRYELVPKLLEAWCISAGQHDPNLLNRRMGEGRLWITPDPPEDAVSDEAKLAFARNFGLFELVPAHHAIEDDAPPTDRNA